MGRSSYTQSVSTSTRTFQTAPKASETPKPRAKWQLPKLPNMPKMPKITNVTMPATTDRLPWLLAAGLLLISIFLFVQYREAQHKLRSPQVAAANARQVNDTLAKVSKLVIVPSGETPTVVTVAHPEKLVGQSFFANAKVGDKVIVYNKAKEAILYRPSTNQIVTIAPVTGTQ